MQGCKGAPLALAPSYPRTLGINSPNRFIPGWSGDDPSLERLDVELLARAYRFSAAAHEGQFRRNGDPFVTHCVEVAKILAELQLDSITVAAGLIHDVVEDTAVTIEEVEQEFGPEIDADRRRADQDRRAAAPQHAKSARSRTTASCWCRSRRTRASSSSSSRTGCTTCARWTRCRRTSSVASRSRRATCTRRSRTASVWRRCGGSWRTWRSSSSSRRTTGSWPSSSPQSAAEREALIKQMAEPLQRVLTDAGIQNVEVTGRAKHLWSIYRKMEKRERPYEEIYDLLAIRVLVNSVPDCYHALGVIHDGWTPLQERIKDYIAPAEVERVPVAAHDGLRPRAPALRDPDPHPRDASHGGDRHRRALALQDRRQVGGRTRPPPAVVPAGARAAARREGPGRVPGVPEARPVPGRDLRLHPDG